MLAEIQITQAVGVHLIAVTALARRVGHHALRGGGSGY